MKLSDALAKILKKNGVSHVFGLQGGGVVHIFDSLERNGIGVTYMHHEESAALAAVAHAKVTGKLGCVVVTTGPGATNAITGLLAGWQDSVPCLFVSGQVRSQHTSYGRKVRQVGTQEVNICDIVRPITKDTKFINDKENFVSELNHAIEVARSGRPGPVWLDLPLDYQWADIEFDEKLASTNTKEKEGESYLDFDSASESLTLLSQSTRPLLILGYGIRLAGGSIYLDKLIEQHEIPFVTTWTASDLFATDHPLNLGIIGMSGQRGANRAVFHADLFICLGTHLSIPHTTTLFDSYAPQAKKVIVNIDGDQLDNLNVQFDLKIKGDVATYIEWLSKKNIKKFNWPDISEFKGQNWYSPNITPLPNSNVYIRELTKQTTGKICLVVDGGGTALYAGFQSSVLKSSDRIICSSTISAMGTGLAETVGVSKFKEFSKILCVIGDGSFLMNVQDLQSIRYDNINVIISVINNNGYLAIRNTQKEFLGGRLYGTHPEWSLGMPSIEKIANAFEIPYVRLDKAEDVERVVHRLSLDQGPIICEVVVDENQDVLFKQGYVDNGDGTFSPQPLSEMAPFL
ncbi:MAG: acetolactate synthase [Nitrosomonadaceae bacterium]|nr:acetolactate synthase [Nitrosomonadaceae bacterium]|tara:strand:+ start:793 stop:2511 length:1719 start_codon:yes stop_codon:yes gene_type:complete